MTSPFGLGRFVPATSDGETPEPGDDGGRERNDALAVDGRDDGEDLADDDDDPYLGRGGGKRKASVLTEEDEDDVLDADAADDYGDGTLGDALARAMGDDGGIDAGGGEEATAGPPPARRKRGGAAAPRGAEDDRRRQRRRGNDGAAMPMTAPGGGAAAPAGMPPAVAAALSACGIIGRWRASKRSCGIFHRPAGRVRGIIGRG